MSEQRDRLVEVTVEIVESNLDKASLISVELGETLTDTINRALAFYHEVMAAEPGRTVSWTFVDGSRGGLIRTR